MALPEDIESQLAAMDERLRRLQEELEAQDPLLSEEEAGRAPFESEPEPAQGRVEPEPVHAEREPAPYVEPEPVPRIEEPEFPAATTITVRLARGLAGSGTRSTIQS